MDVKGNHFRTLRADEIECRVSQVSQKGVALLLYKDARCDMNILDEVVGPMNWKRQHTRENANCIVSIWDADKGQWISKEDTGTESNTEAQKGLASDSFKRACVNFGIGRELYTAPFIWIPADSCRIETGKNGKPACYDRFDVKEIDYNDRREISNLIIVNEKTGQKVFIWQKTPLPELPKRGADPGPVPKKKPEPKPEPPQESTPYFTCEKCGKRLEPYITDEGTEIPIRRHVARSQKMFEGKIFCLDCIKAYKGGSNA